MATSDVFNETFYRARCACSRKTPVKFVWLRACERFAGVIVGLRMYVFLGLKIVCFLKKLFTQCLCNSTKIFGYLASGDDPA